MTNKKNILRFINQIKNHKRKDTPVFLEPRFYKAELKKYNVFRATYDEKMYNKLAIAIIKPVRHYKRLFIEGYYDIYLYERIK